MLPFRRLSPPRHASKTVILYNCPFFILAGASALAVAFGWLWGFVRFALAVRAISTRLFGRGVSLVSSFARFALAPSFFGSGFVLALSRPAAAASPTKSAFCMGVIGCALFGFGGSLLLPSFLSFSLWFFVRGLCRAVRSSLCRVRLGALAQARHAARAARRAPRIFSKHLDKRKNLW